MIAGGHRDLGPLARIGLQDEPYVAMILRTPHVGIGALLALGAGCTTTNYPYRMEMMPPPAIFATGVVPSPDEEHPELRDGVVLLPYATPREPAGEDDDEPYYRNARGSVLRLGVAVVSATAEEKSRSNEEQQAPGEDAAPLLLEVAEAEELGVLPATQVPFAPADFAASAAESGPRDFAAALDRTLLDGSGRDIYIYIHGYKVVFENAAAVSTELWHYLDYDGAFVAFDWASTPRSRAYFGDLETAEVSAILLRRFLTYLATDTQARRIHIVGYSAGTRSSHRRLLVSRCHSRPGRRKRA